MDEIQNKNFPKMSELSKKKGELIFLSIETFFCVELTPINLYYIHTALFQKTKHKFLCYHLMSVERVVRKNAKLFHSLRCCCVCIIIIITIIIISS